MKIFKAGSTRVSVQCRYTVSVILLLGNLFFNGCSGGSESVDPYMDFESRIQKPSRLQVFEMEDYFVWGASVVQGDDGRYYMFASRWLEKTKMGGWLTHSQIIRAVGEKPEGPFQFQEELAVLKEQAWAKHMVHNPTVFKYNGTYYLAYIGAYWIGYEGGREAFSSWVQGKRQAVRFTQRIGLASAPDPEGPWTPLPSNPILEPRPGKWDSTFTTNPAICITPDNKILLMYKSTRGIRDPLLLGLAIAERPEGPYKRIGREPLFEHNIEDPYVWYEKDRYWMVTKDMTGDICGIRGAGILYTSSNITEWELAEHPLAYRMSIEWQDGETLKPNRLERPQILVQNGRAICFYSAVLEEDRKKSWNLARLLQ